MMNGEFGEVFSRIPLFFSPNSPFSPIHLFFNFPKLLNSYFLSFPSRSALIRVYPRQKNPFLFSVFSFPQLSSSFLFQTAKLLPFLQFSQTGKLLIFFLPLQICVNPRLSAAKISFPFFCFFVSSDFSPFFFHTTKLLPFKLFSRRKMSYFSFGRAHWHTSHRWWLRFPEANWKAWFFQEAGIW